MAKQFQTKTVQSSLIASAVLGVVVGFYTGYVRAESYKCPVPEITVGADTCTSRGCKLYKGSDGSYGPWVCDYVYSGPNPNYNCPPLEMCAHAMGDEE